MKELLESIYQGILFTPLLEWVAVLTSIMYVILAARQNISCWYFAFLTSSLYVYLCFTNQLYIETVLQLFYVLMAFYGWFQWRKHENMGIKGAEESETPALNLIRTWPLKYHALVLSAGVVMTLIFGMIFRNLTDQQNAFIDAFTTVFSLVATYMVTSRVLENWIYWVVIDIVSIYLYYERGLKLSALLFVIFTLLAIFGFFKWLRSYKSIRS